MRITPFTRTIIFTSERELLEWPYSICCRLAGTHITDCREANAAVRFGRIQRSCLKTETNIVPLKTMFTALKPCKHTPLHIRLFHPDVVTVAYWGGSPYRCLPPMIPHHPSNAARRRSSTRLHIISDWLRARRGNFWQLYRPAYAFKCRILFRTLDRRKNQ